MAVPLDSTHGNSKPCSTGFAKDRIVKKRDVLGISHISMFCMFLCSTNHHPGLCFYSRNDEFDSGATSWNSLASLMPQVKLDNNYGLKIMSL